jgi:hypothetical protein
VFLNQAHGNAADPLEQIIERAIDRTDDFFFGAIV